MAFESQRLLADRLSTSVEQVSDIETDDLPASGKEREAVVRVRVNQSFFRRRVLSAYCFKCCVTGLTLRPLLVAGHVIPWAKDTVNRLNPRNGLCLNALHDRAFDCGLMWVAPQFVVRLSPKMREANNDSKETIDWLMSFDGKPLLLPRKFQPDPQLLAIHASLSGH